MSLHDALGSKGTHANLQYPSEATHRKIIQAGSYTVPKYVTGISPSSQQSSAIPVAGATIYAIDHNDAGFVPMATFKPRYVKPEQVISCVIASNLFQLLVDGHVVWQQQGTSLTAGSVMFFVQ